MKTKKMGKNLIALKAKYEVDSKGLKKIVGGAGSVRLKNNNLN